MSQYFRPTRREFLQIAALAGVVEELGAEVLEVPLDRTDAARQELGAPDLPFIAGLIAPHSNWPHADVVRAGTVAVTSTRATLRASSNSVKA